MSQSSQSVSPNAPPRRHTAFHIFLTFTAVVLSACCLLFFAKILATGMLAARNLLLYMVALLFVAAGYFLLRRSSRVQLWCKLLFAFLALLLSAALIWAGLPADSLRTSLSKITGNLSQTDHLVIVVMDDSSWEEIPDMNGCSFGYIRCLDTDETYSLIGQLKSRLFRFQTCPQSSLVNLVDSLYHGTCDAIILNMEYLQMLEESENHATFEQKTRVIYGTAITSSIQKEKYSGDIPNPFFVFCAGLDSKDGSIPERGSNSLNTMIAVNPHSHQILLVNTPAEYYIPLSFTNVSDKMCYIGQYGIKASADTLRKLYHITKDCYCVHLNTNALADVVDALGGVDVECEIPFSSTTAPHDASGADSSFSFTVGSAHMDGAEALAYFSERSAFQDGGNQAARNQAAVLCGIIEKMASVDRHSDMQILLDSFAGACTNNISYGEIANLIQWQQNHPQKWQVWSYSVSGQMASADSFSYPGELHDVLRPDQGSISIACDLISQIMSGSTPDIPTP